MKRPVYLNLLLIRQPIGAIASIVHRITGAVLTLSIPVALCVLQASLENPERFEEMRAWLSQGFGRVLMLLGLWALVQHLYSGIRHLFMDVDVGMTLPAARRNAWLTFVGSVITVAILGVWL